MRVEILDNGSYQLLWQENKVISSAGPGMDLNSLKLSGVGLSVCPTGISFPDQSIPMRLIKAQETQLMCVAAFFFSSTVKDNEGLQTPHKTLWSSKNRMTCAGAKGQGSVLSRDEVEERNIRHRAELSFLFPQEN